MGNDEDSMCLFYTSTINSNRQALLSFSFPLLVDDQMSYQSSRLSIVFSPFCSSSSTQTGFLDSLAMVPCTAFSPTCTPCPPTMQIIMIIIEHLQINLHAESKGGPSKAAKCIHTCKKGENKESRNYLSI